MPVRSLFIVAVALLSTAASSIAAPPMGDPTETAHVRLKFQRGSAHRYNLSMVGNTAWAPHVEGVQWGQLATDFTFTLATKTIRPDGNCTFALLGETLRAAGTTSTGRIDVAATRQGSRVGVRGRDSVGLSSRNSPLRKPMTVTLDPRGRYRFGTGLAPLVIYMLPQVDHRFWTLLTTAPEQPVAPGQREQVSFQMPVPGAQGRPLQVSGTWEVVGWQMRSQRRVLAFRLVARLAVDDLELILKNGDQAHFTEGKYHAEGEALWDVEAGLLVSATAQQSIMLTSDRPIPRVLRSENKCSLQLVASQKAAAEH